ncbi:aminomethyl-transferring glycine dehydrogenase [Corynebacterium sp. MSK006]|uniref:aminomethyl-transferring glycine dehydrogenase n=1 Tax=Corynebacterium sp. MSK006 TaxID=3050187 RepID=UPI002551114A|nr:aminomethyl-transferring glycine dehydrogenase [Corynebacterium sp. MSK006]MDK8894421.1 aminomethyl-transferring glycine dehydrogenase [Corynebacterium sp. MSK006]
MTSAYTSRHIGPDQKETAAMLAAVGQPDLEALISAALPAAVGRDNSDTVPEIGEPLSEADAQAKLRGYAEANTVLRAFYGQGFSDTVTPPVIRRGVLEDPGWYTAYTPYQPEISQGRLEALLNFQTLVAELTGLPVANASLLDEATAVAEAVGLMARAQRKGTRVLLDSRLHPQVLAVAAERARALALEVEVGDATAPLVGEGWAGSVIAYPGTEGDLVDPRGAIEEMHGRGGLVTLACDLLALQLTESPGTLGADIAVGSSQRFGVPLFYGGPHAGFMSVADKLKRKMPGRLVGVSKDVAGMPAYRLALQTREQHIRRERATSNICTAQALLAVTASMYAVYHGAEGLKAIAEDVHARAVTFAAAIEAAENATVRHADFFDTVTVEVPGRARAITDALAEAGYLVRPLDEDAVAVSFGESATIADVAVLADAFAAPLRGAAGEENGAGDGTTGDGTAEGSDGTSASIPETLRRTTPTLEHPIFHSVHSETQMMRYLRRLSDKDLALDRTMIPLGSCTMKLNPAAGMEAISWPGFADVHPYTPARFTPGWKALIYELTGWLVDITGYAAVSLQPNSGSMGELAGLLAIRRYHVSRGDHERDICLVPSSAHGTNAASAALAHLKVVVVDSAEDGSIDVEDLKAKLDKHGEHVAAIMITYPSTHGVFEENVTHVCDLVHGVGGQVYIDGANMNALSGIARPGRFGGDVSHLNLHKTFAIPHGGGGPGVGPIGVAEHLVDFLPTDPTTAGVGPAAVDEGVPMVGTLFGSAGVLPISWAYLAMSGTQGLRRNSAHAILAANYVAEQLHESFPVLYTGPSGLVAHECILDLRELTDASGVTAADVCKRLVDYGFHAPTLAFPVAGTLMVEPTESEDLGELDRFITAMRSIRAEIQEIIDGEVSHEESVLAQAPFTAAAVGADEWPHPFTRRQAAWPVDSLYRDKYFPPVRRIDEAYGDRHLVCSCPPPEAFDISGDDSESAEV